MIIQSPQAYENLSIYYAFTLWLPGHLHAEDGPPNFFWSELAPLQLITHDEGSIGHSLVASHSLWLSLRTIQLITVVKRLTAGYSYLYNQLPDAE